MCRTLSENLVKIGQNAWILLGSYKWGGVAPQPEVATWAHAGHIFRTFLKIFLIKHDAYISKDFHDGLLKRPQWPFKHFCGTTPPPYLYVNH